MGNVKIYEEAKTHETDQKQLGLGTFARRALVAILIAVGILLLLAFLWFAVDVLLLIFAGILLAILLRSMSDWLGARTRLSPRWSLAVVILAIIGLLGTLGWLLAPQVAEQVNELVETLPESVQHLRQRIEQYPWMRQLLAETPRTGEVIPNQSEVVSQAAGFFSTTFGAFVDFIVILVFGIYFAINPNLYIRGIIRLVPLSKRNRAREVVHAVGYTLRWWLIGRIFAMVAVGALIALGLWLLNIPLALTFGILAGLLDFIPIVGPLIAAVPPLLLSLTQDPMQALYVAALYVVVQSIESYLLTPVVQMHAVSLPPVVTLAAISVIGVLFGGIGLLLATPLAAIAMVLVKMLYIEDVLGDSVETPGEDEA
jgi:predicted PurR-regulated permease PerM